MGVSDAHGFPSFLTSVLTQLSFQSHQLLFSFASAQVTGNSMPEKSSLQLGIEVTNTKS